MKKISIIIPVYNKENEIINSLNSIKKQTIDNYEIVIVDDGSSDRSVEIIKKYLKMNKELDCRIISQTNRGVSSARNIGILNSKGRYIFFMDGDDIIAENCLETLVINMESKNIDFSICGYEVLQGSKLVNFNREIDSQIYNNIDFLKLFIKSKVHIYMGNALYKSEIIKDNKIMFDCNYKYNEDQIFIYKYLLNCNKIFFDNNKLFRYIRTESSVTMKASGDRISNVKIFIDFKKYLNEIDFIEKEEIVEVISGYKIPYSIAIAIMNLIDLGCNKNELISIIKENKKIVQKIKYFKFKYGRKMFVNIKLIQYLPNVFFYLRRNNRRIKNEK